MSLGMAESSEQLPVDISLGASARAELGASLRVRKQILRLESDRFEVCDNYILHLPPPPALRLFLRERIRVIHNYGEGVWEIIDPTDPRTFPRRELPTTES